MLHDDDAGGTDTFARLFALTDDLLCVFDADGLVRAASGASSVLGQPCPEIVGTNLLDRLHAGDAESMRPRLASMTIGAFPVRFESRCLLTDGTYRWLAWKVLRDAESTYFAAIRDATERKWVEHELEASLSLVNATLESTADGLLVVDEGGAVVTFNRRFLEIWGIPDSIVFAGLTEIDRFFEPALATTAGYLSTARELLEAAASERYQLLALADGRVFERYSRPRQIGGARDGRVWSFRDVTERVRAERELREHLNIGIDHAVEGIGRTDAAGRYTSVNAVFSKILGFEPGELIGRESGALCLPEDFAAAQAARNALTPGDKVETELRAVRKDGAVIVLRALNVRATDGGFHVFVKDITQQKEMERRLLLADRMSSMGALAAGVAHEINNPLTFVLANAVVLAEALPKLGKQLDDQSHAELTAVVSDLRAGAERVQGIVRDLKMFSRHDDTVEDAVDVHRVLDATVNMVSNEVRPRARLAKDYGHVGRVKANEGQLGQVFLNLLVNAAHAIPEGHVEGNEIRITTSTAPDGRVAIEIRDTGRGIAANLLPRIFDPFFTTKPVGMGTGLGLSVCHGIISKLGGEISVASQVGAGTTFRVLLTSVVDLAKGTRPLADAEPQAAPRARILVVDDEVLIGTVLRRMLSKSYDIVLCTGGRSALELLAEQPDFQVILCDLMMPDISGMDVHAELARLAPELARRMVFMTGGAFTPRAKAFLEGVPNHRVDKPIDIARLREWIQTSLTSARG